MYHEFTNSGYGFGGKSKLLGEVLFLRAFYYYYLVRLYGDIPCITEVISTNSPDFYPKRSSVADIYDKIIVPDLLEAEKPLFRIMMLLVVSVKAW